MKRTLSLLALLVSTTFVVAQPKKGKTNLPNAVPVKGEYLFAAETEVTNFQYLEFLFHQRKISEENYKINLPDTLRWRSKIAYCQPYVDYYFRHPAYRNYPVVTVTHDQAKAYCDWLTGMLNDQLKNWESPIKKLVVRLPTEEEWETAALSGLSDGSIFPWEGTGMRSLEKKYEGSFLANFKRGSGTSMGVAGKLNDNGDITAPGHAYWPNPIGLYNMAGNVAEMIDEPGRTKGGSWANTGGYLQVRGEDPYKGWTEASPHIGFRYFIEVLEWQPKPKKKPLVLSAKTIEKWMVYIPDSAGFWASQLEVTNGMYKFFLEELKSNGAGKEHLVKHAKWDEHYPYTVMRQYGQLPQYDDYPVVNISHESAVAFCEWLTKVYHGFPDREYKNAKFKLPSLEEWELAARGGMRLSPYPWGGPYQRNAKGQFLCNFNPQELRFLKQNEKGEMFYDYPNDDIRISRDLDGHESLSEAQAYFPNDYGLYQCAGNAAEMLDEKGISKGGSWTSTSYFIQNGSVEKYDAPSASLGFRLFMVDNDAATAEANP